MAKAKKAAAFEPISLGEYKGNPLLVFRSDAEDRYVFKFGRGKASKLLDAIKAVGVEAFVQRLTDFVGEDAEEETADAA